MGSRYDSDVDLWGADFLSYTPPLSPDRDLEYDISGFYSSEAYNKRVQTLFGTTEFSTDIHHLLDTDTPELSDGDFKSKIVLQDCMWSGIGYGSPESSGGRRRRVSLSELTMVTASTSCVDPTTFTAYPRQQNQVEHNYSLATPEPMRIPKLHTYSSPASTDDSESEEDVIDVVTVDTRTRPSSSTSSARVYTKHNTLYKVRNDLQAVAQKLSSHSYKRSKYMSDYEFPPSKKAKRILSTQSSVICSQSSSDSEEFEGKRSAHNVMERHRRNELKNSLHGLRDSLPSLETQERAPKVVILAHATQYVRELQAIESSLNVEHNKLKSKNSRLKEKLAYLQSRLDYF